MWLIAGGWAGLAAMSLLLGGVAVRLFKPSVRFVAVVMALGSGVLIASVAYDLVAEASPETPIHLLLLSLIAGALVFVLGSKAIGRMGGRRRKAPQGSDDSSGSAIALGSILDGLPESLVLGLTVLSGGVSP